MTIFLDTGKSRQSLYILLGAVVGNSAALFTLAETTGCCIAVSERL